MKKISTLVSFFAIFAMSHAQYCGGSGTSVCTPSAPTGNPGLTPTSDLLPCFVKGVPVNQVIQFENFTTAQGYPVNWLKIDSISNLPPGLCWKTSSPTNTFNGGATGCILVTGTPLASATPGQYKMRLIIDVNVSVSGFPLTLSNQNAETVANLRYYARLKCSSLAPCPAVDTTLGKTMAIIPYSNPSATVNLTPSGTVSTCSGAITLKSGATNAVAYKWSNGATTDSITITAPAAYKVTVYGACGDSVVSATTTVTGPTFSPIITSTSSVYCGTALTLTATPSGATNYQWYKGTAAISGANSSTYSATAAGTYSCSVTQSGCTVASNNLVISSGSGGSLTPTITPSATMLCPGTFMKLSATTGYTTYSWSNGLHTSVDTITSAGSYTVTCTLVGGGCSVSGTATINISVGPTVATPSVVSSASYICNGQSAVLSSPTNHQTYLWSNGLSTPTITVTSSGTYSLTVTDSAFCGTANASYNLAAGANVTKPTISASRPTVCNGLVAILNAGTGYTSYSWSNSGMLQTDTILSPGTYFVTVTKTGQCGSAIDSFVIKDGTFTCSASNVGNNLTALPAGATYQWVLNGTNIPSANSQTYTGTVAGNYTVKMGLNGCYCSSNSIGLNVGIENIADDLHYQISPNPTTDKVTIHYSLTAETKVEIQVLDITGKIVSTISKGKQSIGNYEMDQNLSSFSKGIYFVKLITDRGIATSKLIKE